MNDTESSSALNVKDSSGNASAQRRCLNRDEINSPEARMDQICELLSKAVARDWIQRVLAEEPAPEVPAIPLAHNEKTADTLRILSYLALVGEANSAGIRESLGLSRMRVYRAIRPLVTGGRIVIKGQSRMTSYVLSAAEAGKVGLN